MYTNNSRKHDMERNTASFTNYQRSDTDREDYVIYANRDITIIKHERASHETYRNDPHRNYLQTSEHNVLNRNSTVACKNVKNSRVSDNETNSRHADPRLLAAAESLQKAARACLVHTENNPRCVMLDTVMTALGNTQELLTSVEEETYEHYPWQRQNIRTPTNIPVGSKNAKNNHTVKSISHARSGTQQNIHEMQHMPNIGNGNTNPLRHSSNSNRVNPSERTVDDYKKKAQLLNKMHEHQLAYEHARHRAKRTYYHTWKTQTICTHTARSNTVVTKTDTHTYRHLRNELLVEVKGADGKANSYMVSETSIIHYHRLKKWVLTKAACGEEKMQ